MFNSKFRVATRDVAISCRGLAIVGTIGEGRWNHQRREEEARVRREFYPHPVYL